LARRSQIGPRLGQVRFGLTQLGLHLQQLGLRVGFFIHNGDVITSGRLDSLFGCGSFIIQYLLAPVLRFGLLDPSGIGSYGGFRPFDIGGRGVDVSLSSFDLPGQGLNFVAGAVQSSASLFQSRFKCTRIDLKQQVAGLDKLVVHNRQMDDRGGNPGRDLNDLCAHLAVPGPGMDDIIPILDQNHNHSDQYDRTGQQIFRFSFHGLPLSLI
jgi:hypothetical protein